MAPAGDIPGRIFDHVADFHAGRATSVVLLLGVLVTICALALLVLWWW